MKINVKFDADVIDLPDEFKENHQSLLEKGVFDDVIKKQNGGREHGEIVSIGYCLMEQRESRNIEIEGTLGTKRVDLLDKNQKIILEARKEKDLEYLEDRASSLVSHILTHGESRLDHWDFGLVTEDYKIYILTPQKVSIDYSQAMKTSPLLGLLRTFKEKMSRRKIMRNLS